MNQVTFRIGSDNSSEYCDRCQQLGDETGIKMHRNLPTQVWAVEASFNGTLDGKEYENDIRWLNMCSDCLYDADKAEPNSSEEVTVTMCDGSPFNTKGMFLIRNTPKKEETKDGS